MSTPHVSGIGNPETPAGRQRAYAAEDYAMRGERCGDCNQRHGGKCQWLCPRCCDSGTICTNDPAYWPEEGPIYGPCPDCTTSPKKEGGL